MALRLRREVLRSAGTSTNFAKGDLAMNRCFQGRLTRATLGASLFLLHVAVASAQCTSTTTDPYLDCAKQAYGALATAVDYSNNYWRIGNVADSMFDFLAVLSPEDFARFNSIEGNARGCTGSMTLAQYFACRYPVYDQQSSGCWYNDYGWWGIAASKAFDPEYDRIFKDSYATQETFEQIARTAWGIFHDGKRDGIHEGAPWGWENRENRTGFSRPWPEPVPDQLSPPRFEGGVWQYDLFTNPRTNAQHSVANWVAPPECSGQTMNPVKTGLGPYQDTVVNGLYFVLAQRLLALDSANRADHEAAVTAEYGFLRSWFGYDQGYMLPTVPGATCPFGCDNDKALLQLYPPPAQGGATGSPALVYERVSTYGAPPHSTAPYPQVQNWKPTTFWAGDQGLVLGGLIDYARSHPDDAMSPEVAQMIVKGVMSQMAGSDYGVTPWLPWSDDGGGAPGGEPGDYESGSGILMRYLLYAYEAQFPGNPIPTLVHSQEFQAFLRRAADTAYCHFNTFRPGDNSTFPPFNLLATMVTARQLLLSPPESVTCSS
jgi:hypothetical protein